MASNPAGANVYNFDLTRSGSGGDDNQVSSAVETFFASIAGNYDLFWVESESDHGRSNEGGIAIVSTGPNAWELGGGDCFGGACSTLLNHYSTVSGLSDDRGRLSNAHADSRMLTFGESDDSLKYRWITWTSGGKRILAICTHSRTPDGSYVFSSARVYGKGGTSPNSYQFAGGDLDDCRL